jgi:hypothetical protein
MYKNLTLALGLFSILAAGSSTARAEEVPPSNDRVFIKNATGRGDGCPAGTMQAFITSDGEAMTVLFDQYTASYVHKPDQKITENRKKCTLTVGLHVPAGFTVAISRVEYRGFMNLDAGIRAQQLSTYRFTGGTGAPEAKLTSTYVGPTDELGENYFIDDEFELQALNFTRCGVDSILLLGTEIRVGVPTGGRAKPMAQGVISTDTIDQKLETKYRFTFRRCNK